ncbi:MAG: sigma-54-dependent Fis family transcriptional regulator [Desulfobacterales bacterium]|nr:sigma-54-dependent Fis family transcriptional regulator [Desulfobacterales bacterium]
MSDTQFFHEATLLICGSLDIEKALDESFKHLRQHIPMDRMVMSLYEEQLKCLRCIALADGNGGRAMDILVPLSREAREEEREVSGNLDVMVYNDPDTCAISREWAAFFDIGDSSYIVMKLQMDTGLVGTLTLEARGRDRFLPEHARLLGLVCKPFAVAMSNALQHQKTRDLSRRLSEENVSLYKKLMHVPEADVVGAESGLRHVFSMVRNVAGVDSPVLLLGETGVGKDVVANAVHNLSPRTQAPLIKVNCGAIPPTLLDSELFGHEKGAFTGAHSQRRGFFERANTGTLFLDEIGELPPEAQVRLLRVLQHKEIERVGGSRPISVDVRIIAATNRDLLEMVEAGSFRQDLWFRLNVFPIEIPPLRDRREDIPGLAARFLASKSKELNIYPVPGLSRGAMDRLMAYDWPGNVRELENVVERSLILNPGRQLRFDTLVSPPASTGAGPTVPSPEEILPLDEMNARYIKRVLAHTNGRIEGPNGAAKLLDINPSTLRNRMVKLGIPFGAKSRKTGA